jgi:addiction module RelE/StbE family toxin
MQIRWSPGAAEDLEYIFSYIARDSQAAAQRVVKGVYDRAGTLSAFPYLGKTGRVKGTRELPLTPLPYIIVYRALDPVDAVEIVSVIHAAQCWPPLA